MASKFACTAQKDYLPLYLLLVSFPGQIQDVNILKSRYIYLRCYIYIHTLSFLRNYL